VLFLFAVQFIAYGQPRTYTNPVLHGDFPDPSVIRVGRDYWATATTSEWAPEFPILHSRDLLNWTIAGAVFQRRPSWSTGNYWAPEISTFRGRYFVYYVGHKQNGSLCVAVATASRPSGPYRDRGPLVCQEAGSIDPVPVTDESGARYLLWKEDGNSRNQPTPIWAQRLSRDGTKLVGEKTELIRNTAPWEAQLVEGPFVVRRNGWFYLFYSGNACCGRECNYALGVARSRRLLGPWEKNPQNPILKGNETWKCPGHGSIVSDQAGRDFLLYHAYQNNDFVYVGRQGLLDQVEWKNDWPIINAGRGPSEHARVAFGSGEPKRFDTFKDEFQTRLPGWQWPQANEPLVRIESARGGRLLLSPNEQEVNNPIGAVYARSTTSGNYVAQTTIDMRGLTGGAVAGLSAYGDGENAIGVIIGDGRVELWLRRKNTREVLQTSNAPSAGIVFLRMTASEGHRFRFAFSSDQIHWREIGEEIDGSFLPPWDRGVRVALTAGGKPGMTARFEWLTIEPTK